MNTKNFDSRQVVPIYFPKQSDKKIFRPDKRTEYKKNKVFITFIFLLTIAACICLLGAWLWLGRIEESVQGHGQIIPEKKIRRIASPISGVVSRLLVQENQKVKAGQPIIELDPQLSEIDQNGFADELKLYREEESAIQNAFANRSTGKGGGFQAAWVNATRDSYNSQMESAKMQISKLQHQYFESLENYKKTKDILVESEKMLIQYRTLYSEGGLPANQYKEYEQKVMDQRGQLSALTEELKSKNIELEQAKQAPKQIIGNFNKELLDKLAENRKNIVSLSSQLQKAGVSLKHTVITSPVDGIVNEETIRGEGETVGAGQSLLSIVPEKSKMVAEIKVTNKDFSYIHPGQRVALRIDAFPYQHFGRLFGSIVAISPSSLPDRDGKAFYVLKVKPDKAIMTSQDGQKYPLVSGMTLSADIITRKKNILSFLDDPIREQLDRAFRDPTSR